MGIWQCVVETEQFLRDARSTGMSDDERWHVVTAYSLDPQSGDEVPGSGGLRKTRFAAPGGGKRGGYRILSFYLGPNYPVFLISMLKKSDRANFTPRQIGELAKMAALMKFAIGVRR